MPRWDLVSKYRYPLHEPGPHGECWLDRTLPNCVCPEPLNSAILGWYCLCCEGAFTTPAGARYLATYVRAWSARPDPS